MEIDHRNSSGARIENILNIYWCWSIDFFECFFLLMLSEVRKWEFRWKSKPCECWMCTDHSRITSFWNRKGNIVFMSLCHRFINKANMGHSKHLSKMIIKDEWLLDKVFENSNDMHIHSWVSQVLKWNKTKKSWFIIRSLSMCARTDCYNWYNPIGLVLTHAQKQRYLGNGIPYHVAKKWQ